METEYKGFKIKEIYQSADGRGNMDYFIMPAINKAVFMPEKGECKMATSLRKIKLAIDELLTEA
jgi:hypothetical protein